MIISFSFLLWFFPPWEAMTAVTGNVGITFQTAVIRFKRTAFERPCFSIGQYRVAFLHKTFI